MNRRHPYYIFVTSIYFIFIFLVWGCSGKVKNEIPGEETAYSLEFKNENDLSNRINHLTDSLLTSLTLEERVGQCMMPSILSVSEQSNLILLQKWIKDYHIGGIVLLKGNKKAVKTLKEEETTSKIPLLISIDAEWGLGMRLEDGSIYPQNGYLPLNLDESELYDYGRAIAEECKELGINMVLGPVIDINAKKSGVIGRRAFSNNPFVVSEYGVAYAKGLESGGIISVAKHFPGHGRALNDSHRKIAVLNEGIAILDTMELQPFRDYVNQNLSGIMAGHIRALTLDPDGNPASVSFDMLTSLLREEMGFRGLIMTDAFEMGGAEGFSATDALKAGADIILCPSDVKKEYEEVIDNVASGNLSLEIINERCRRILFYKFLFGVIN